MSPIPDGPDGRACGHSPFAAAAGLRGAQVSRQRGAKPVVFGAAPQLQCDGRGAKD